MEVYGTTWKHKKEKRRISYPKSYPLCFYCNLNALFNDLGMYLDNGDLWKQELVNQRLKI